MAIDLRSRALWPVRIVVFTFILAALLWASPSEETLGDFVKVVYVHGALIRVGELVFIASGVLGLVHLLRGSSVAIDWCWALQKTAVASWAISFLASLFIMSAAWGGVNLAEPRFVATGRILSVAAIGTALGYLVAKPKLIAWTSIVLGLTVVVEIASAGLMLHPTNPIGTSPSLMTKVYYYAITVALLALAAETSRLLVPVKAQKS